MTGPNRLRIRAPLLATPCPQFGYQRSTCLTRGPEFSFALKPVGAVGLRARYRQCRSDNRSISTDIRDWHRTAASCQISSAARDLLPDESKKRDALALLGQGF